MDCSISQLLHEVNYSQLLQKLLVGLFAVVFIWKMVRHMWGFLNLEKEPVVVLVTGAAGMLLFIFILNNISLRLRV